MFYLPVQSERILSGKAGSLLTVYPFVLVLGEVSVRPFIQTKYQRGKIRTKTKLPSPLLAARSPCFDFLARTLSSFRGVVVVVGVAVVTVVFAGAWCFSMLAGFDAATGTLSALTSMESLVSGWGSGLTKVCWVRGSLWRLALGCCAIFSELSGRCRRRERVAVAGPPSRTDGENMVNRCQPQIQLDE